MKQGGAALVVRALGCRAISADDEVSGALDVTVDTSVGTHFTAGVVRTNFARLPWPDRLRFAARAISRRALGALR